MSKIILREIPLFDQNISEKDIKNVLRLCYDNISFSTFPYKVYKETSSKEALQKYNSGNCIALTIFCQEMLWKNHKVKSYIIPASVPEMYRLEGTKHLTHVSLCIPFCKTCFYVIDPAFHFMEPIVCDIRSKKEGAIMAYNIHDDMREDIVYSVGKCNNRRVDYDQEIYPNSYCVRCVYSNLPDKEWYYYINEVVNPDEAIGKIYVSLKPEPFITISKFDFRNNKPLLVYNIKVKDDGTINIKNKDEERNTNIYDDEKTRDLLFKKYSKYFSNYIY